MKAVHFGAGNIGRGFIGYLLSQSGYDVCFVDISEKVIDELNRYRAYTVTILNGDSQVEKVTGVRGVNIKDEAALERELLEADLITTSIGVNNLAGLGETLKAVLAKRALQGAAPLDVIACENAMFATNILKRAVCIHADESLKAYINENVGFPNCAVDRIVPNVNLPKERGTDVFVEAFYEWSVERRAVKVNDQISGVHYVDLLDPFLERKLFMLNGAHATIAYLGYLKQYTFIHEAIRDASILEVISKFHRQSAEALSLKYKVDLDTLLAYSEKIIKRFRNVHLGDLVVRVGADPVRKLSYDDRLISPLRLCVDFGAEYSAIVSGIAAGYHFDHMDDVKAQKIQASIREEGIQKSVALYSGLLERSVLNRAICEAYEKMK